MAHIQSTYCYRDHGNSSNRDSGNLLHANQQTSQNKTNKSKMLRSFIIRPARALQYGKRFQPYSMSLNQESVVFLPSPQAPFTIGNSAINPLELTRTISGVGSGMVATLWDNIQSGILFLKRTFQPSLIRRKRKHGFLARQATKDGRKILAARTRKGRRSLCA